MLSQGTWALAGTTGGVSGSVTDDSGAPIAGVKITVSAPSETTTTTSDASGHFSFLSLAPDSYTLALAKEGYNPATIAGLTVFADNTQTVALHMSKALTTIVKVASRSTGNLVKPGTTSDVYSVNAATQQILSGSGGGYNLNAAYSALYAQPGVTSYIGNYGWGQVFYIRGGSYSQTGYEFDGVPVNRAFDNYQANSLSSLGQQELQVYTGGSPSGASSATLGGFINQVIKTGTYPGFGAAELGIGAPSFYHQAKIEAGGASPDRLFSYYVGVNGYNQFYPYFTNKNMGDIAADGSSSYGFIAPSAGASLWGPLGAGAGDPASADGGVWPFQFTNGPFPACKADGSAPAGEAPQFVASPAALVPGGACNAFGPYGNGYTGNMFERNSVINLHFGVPHKNDGGKDDIQLLYDNSMQYQINLSSINDNYGLAAISKYLTPYAIYSDPGSPYPGLCGELNFWGTGCATSGNSPIPYIDTSIFAPGTNFGQLASSAKIAPYLFPNSPTNRQPGSGIDPNLRDGFWNNVGIVKAQYQKNFGSTAYARLFAYTFYSDWLISGPTCASTLYANGALNGGMCGETPDYELGTHTRGLEFKYANQINAQNLLQFTANYTTATVRRFNNSSFRSGTSGTYRGVTNFTNGDPNDPRCFNTAGAEASCYSSSTYGSFVSPNKSFASSDPCGSGALAPGTAACLAGAKMLVTVPGGQGTYNAVKPIFSSFALEDEWRPNDKLDVNLGVRLERYQYDLQNTNTPEFNFWFNATSKVVCYDTVTKQPLYTPLTPGQPFPPSLVNTAPGAACPVGPNGDATAHPTNYSAVGPSSYTKQAFSPRIGATYTFDPDTVIRFSAGKYTQPTETAFEQYSDASGKRAANFDFGRFYGLGYNTPGHDNPIQSSNNFDFSLEKHLKGTDITFKLSPFYRLTSNEIVTVPLGPGFVSGVNLGTQRSQGVEFQVSKGDPSRDGLAGSLSYTYTSAKLKYNSPPSGKNAIDYLNNYITGFNALTQAGGGAACYQNSAADPTCADLDGSGAGTIIKNPYYSMSVQPTLDRNAYYDTWPNEPPNDPTDTVGSSAIAPHTFSGFLQYKHGKFAIAPNFQLTAGSYYGYPTDTVGIDPRFCTQNEAAAGAVGGASPYAQNADFLSCGPAQSTSGYLAIPNPQNGNRFDTVGQFQQPWQFNLGAQIRYDFTSKVTASLSLANLINRCFGGTNTPWKSAFQPGAYVCGYSNNTYNYIGATPGAGFFYGASGADAANGTAGYPRMYNYSYGPAIGSVPFAAYLQVQIKL
jgi:outer membrane receptor protein involved in Fe transport